MTTGEMVGYLRAGNKYGILSDEMANDIAARLEEFQKAVDGYCKQHAHLFLKQDSAFRATSARALYALRTPKETPK